MWSGLGSCDSTGRTNPCEPHAGFAAAEPAADRSPGASGWGPARGELRDSTPLPASWGWDLGAGGTSKASSSLAVRCRVSAVLHEMAAEKHEQFARALFGTPPKKGQGGTNDKKRRVPSRVVGHRGTFESSPRQVPCFLTAIKPCSSTLELRRKAAVFGSAASSLFPSNSGTAHPTAA